MEENTIDESNALWEACKDLGLIEDHEANQEQCEHPEKAVKDEQWLRDESEDEEMELKQRTIKVCYRGCRIPKW